MDEDFKTKLGLRIKELRAANRLTQEQLAEKIDIERTYLARIETGKHLPSAENLEKFSEVFNITPSELFNFQHFKSRENLTAEIIEALDTFEIDKVQYIYKSVMNLKSVR